MAIPAKNTLGNPNVTEGNFQVAIEQLRESVIGSGKAYDSANTYMQYDTCVYNGVTYYSKINSNTGNTPSIGTNWGDIADLISSVVHKTGDETIAGVKTLTDGLKLQNKNVSPFSGFKNYIINGKKVINQRGLSSTDNSYNQDRWYKAGNNWFQGIEGDNNLVNGKTYTLSWTGTATASYYVGTATSATINAQSFTSIANGGSFTLTISAGQNLWIKFSSDATGSTFNFVQLEEGSVATPFENRPYGLELSLCQRYYEQIVMYKWFTATDSEVLCTDRSIVTKRVIPTSVLLNIGILVNSVTPEIVIVSTSSVSISIEPINTGNCSANGTTFALSAEL